MSKIKNGWIYFITFIPRGLGILAGFIVSSLRYMGAAIAEGFRDGSL